MLQFDIKTNTLIGRQIQDPDEPLNPLDAQRASYTEFRTQTIYELVRYFFDEACATYSLEHMQLDDVNVKFHSQSDKDGMFDAYYDVLISWSYFGKRVRTDESFLRIPYMDNYGILTVNGKTKVLQNELRSAECLSFDRKKNSMCISLPKRDITISYKDKGIFVNFNQNKIPIQEVIQIYAVELGLDLDITKNFANSKLKTMLSSPYGLQAVTVRGNENKYNQKKTYDSSSYSLGATREAINSLLSLDRAIGRTLSRDVVDTEGTVLAVAGATVDPDSVKLFKQHLITCLYVRTEPEANDLKLSRPYPITYIQKGIPMTDTLSEHLRKYKDELKIDPSSWLVVPEDINLGMEYGLWIMDQTIATKDILKTLLYFVDEVECIAKVDGAQNKVTISAETEILSNSMFRYNEVLTPEQYESYNVKGTDWVYIHNNPTLEPQPLDHLTYHDWLALTSLMMSAVECSGMLYNRDHAFLKRIDLANDIFTRHFYYVIRAFLKKSQKALPKYLKNQSLGNKSPFYHLTHQWIRSMSQAKHLNTADTTNIVEAVSEATHACIITSAVKPPEELRHLALPYYGRIDPYETPAGQRLGLTNTLAIGSRVLPNGLITTAYRRVVKQYDSSGKLVECRISNKIVWLTPMDEIHGNNQAPFKLGSIMDLKFNKDGTIQNTLTIARIPNTDVFSDEPMIVDNIYAYDLDFVGAFSEQHLAFSTCLMPFVSANEASRVTFGLSMIRQSLPIIYGEAPSVITDAYKDIFTKFNVADTVYDEATGAYSMYLNSHCITAKESGIVLDIQRGCIRVMYDNSDIAVEDIYFEEVNTTHYATTLMSIRVNVNDHFEKGQVLASTCLSDEGIYSPGRDCLAGYVITGYNYEDGIHASMQMAADFVSLRTVHVKHPASTSKANYSYRGVESGYRYIKKNDIIAKLEKVDRNNNSKILSDVDWNSGDCEGIFSNFRVEINSGHKDMCVDLVAFNRLGSSDKMSGRHGNKGVTTRTSENSEMPMLNNGLPLDVCLNPLGVSSRMNIGQILEANLSLAAHILGIRINVNSFNGMTTQEIKMLLEYTWMLANTTNITDYEVFEAVCSQFPEIPDELNAVAYTHLSSIIDWRDSFNPDGTARLFDPETETYFENDILIGYPHMLKLRQEGDTKIGLRGGMLDGEQYNMSLLQPTQGGAKHGGQSDGEYELVTFAAHNAANALQELVTTKCDAFGSASNLVCESIPMLSNHIIDESCTKARSLYDFQYYLEALNLAIDSDDPFEEVYPPIDRQSVRDLEYVDPVAAFYEELDAMKTNDAKATKLTINSLADEQWDVGV